MNSKRQNSNRLSARLVRSGLAAVACTLAATVAGGCLDREVSPAQPNTTNVFVEQIVQDSVDKIDLLFMIDNSISMADKQEILRAAVPQLLNRLLDPMCQNPDGTLVPKAGGACPEGTTEEFDPIADIHIGVISSSIGGHGGVICSPALGENFDPTADDQGMLIAPRRAQPSYQEQGFLKWDPNAKYTPPGEAVQATLVTAFTDLVFATGEQGCGYEASLEAWYRFLIDPQPPREVTNAGGVSVLGPVNTDLLEQRARFLRPDSLVAIVMLSDENDCSIRDDGVSWLIGDQGKRLPRGTEVCLTDPNNPCCRSCALDEQQGPPEGCSALGSDPACAQGPYGTIDETLNLRCWEQKRRFGIDFLYPVGRYVDGLKLPTVLGRPCASDAECPSNHPSQAAGTCNTDFGLCEYVNPLNATNPYYPDLVPRQDSSLVFLAGIVGVPWQDISTPESLADANTLEYLRATEDPNRPDLETLSARWDTILGNPATRTAPLDPFMIESIDPRSGTNPVTGDVPQAPTSPVSASPINGHEYTIPGRDDLQYACIFPLGTSRDCATYTGGCDCKAVAGGSADRPLCQAPGTATGGTTQYYAKAYPGLRFLEVLRDFGTNSIVGSVCPKISEPTRSQEAGYGYNPAVKAIIDRLKEKLKGACLPRPLATKPDGSVACQVVEATRPNFGVTCGTAGRGEVEPGIAKVVRQQLEDAGRCGDLAGQTPCDQMQLCMLLPAEGANRDACLNNVDGTLPSPIAGYCYIDAMQDPAIGNPELVADCDPSQRRILRIVSQGVEPPVPFGSSTLFVACQGESLTTE